MTCAWISKEYSRSNANKEIAFFIGLSVKFENCIIRFETEKIITNEKVNKFSTDEISHVVLFLETVQKNDNILSI